MKANSTCIFCLLKKEEKAIENIADERKKAQYIHEVLKILYDYGMEYPAPWLTARIQELQQEHFGMLIDYTEIKHHFNQLLLSQENSLERKIRASEDPIAQCIRYVCAGNYIDFAIPQGVNESILDTMIEKASGESIDDAELEMFKKDISNSTRMTYITDNCGEIVLDKIFIRILKEQNPNLDVTVIVRGAPVINDATMEDAQEVGLTDIAHCIPNGTKVAGTIIEEVSEEAKNALTQADVIISKGMGNFETLYGTGLHPYYLFLCKCNHFVRQFGMDYYSSVFCKEEHIKLL